MTSRAIKYLETGDEAIKRKLTTEEQRWCDKQKPGRKPKATDESSAAEEESPKAKKGKK